MKKREIVALSDTALVAHVVNMESQITKSTNSRGGASKATVQEYKWTIEEMCARFNLDLGELAIRIDATNWWDEGEKR